MPRGGQRPGTGRPSGPQKVPVKIYVLPTTKTAIEKLAFSKNKTLGEVVDDKFPSAIKKQSTVPKK